MDFHTLYKQSGFLFILNALTTFRNPKFQTDVKASPMMMSYFLLAWRIRRMSWPSTITAADSRAGNIKHNRISSSPVHPCSFPPMSDLPCLYARAIDNSPACPLLPPMKLMSSKRERVGWKQLWPCESWFLIHFRLTHGVSIYWGIRQMGEGWISHLQGPWIWVLALTFTIHLCTMLPLLNKEVGSKLHGAF